MKRKLKIRAVNQSLVAISVSVRTVAPDRAQHYLAGIHSLADEGWRTHSPAVILAVLELLQKQTQVIDGLFR